jgi:hypothetical protein
MTQDTFQMLCSKLEGQKVAVLCARYQYRGILHAAGPNALVLSNTTAIEDSGASNLEKPKVEDVIGSTLIIPSDAIEIVYQPNWAQAPLPGEDTRKV